MIVEDNTDGFAAGNTIRIKYYIDEETCKPRFIYKNEEVSDFIGRAVLIRHGKVVGDVTTSELEENGNTLMGYIKETYNYRSDRVSKALDDISGEESK